MEIKVTVKWQYGLERVFVTDKTLATAITVLTGTKTLTPAQIKALKVLGFTFIEEVRT
jgi:hypothetical protein